MIPDSNLMALRSSLPWIFLGWLTLAVSVALWAYSPETEAGALFVSRTTIGAVGSGMILMGLLLLARGRIANRYSHWLVIAFAAWLVEFTLRLSSILNENIDGVALRWLFSSTSCMAMGPGVLWLWDSLRPKGQGKLWVRSTRLFCVQLCAALSLVIAGFTHGVGALDAYHQVRELFSVLPGHALTWLVFAGPYCYLFLVIRQTARCVDKRTSPTEFLHGPPVRK